jgi:hypothetical protein
LDRLRQDDRTPQKIAHHIFASLAMLHEAYTILLDLWPLAYPYMLVCMEHQYERRLKEAFSKQIILEKYTKKPIEQRNFDIKFRCKIAEMLRTDVSFRHKRDNYNLRLSEINFERAPIIFEEHYCEDPAQVEGTEDFQDSFSKRSIADWHSRTTSNKGREDVHLVILVHGYMASSFDMAFLKCQLQRLVGDHVSMVCSQANDADSSTSILELGKRLAADVHETVREYGSVKK